MKSPDVINSQNALFGRAIIGSLFLWVMALTSAVVLGGSALTFLIATAAALLISTAGALLLGTKLSLPFLLPGLLIFFKQNDAISTLIGNVPVVDFLGLAVAFTVLFGLQKNKFRSALSEAALIFILLLGLLLTMVISSVNAVNLQESIKEATTFTKDIVFACLIAFSIRNVADLKNCVNWLIFSTTFSAAIMILDAWNGTVFLGTGEGATWQGSVRSAGGSRESVPDVATMVLIGVLSSGVLAIRATKWRMIYLFAALIGVAAIIASITRSALATFVLTTIWLLWRLRKEAFFPSVFLLSGAIFLLVTVFMPQSMFSKITAIIDTSEDRTITRRLSYQEIGVDLFQSSPFLGIGAGNYPDRFASDDYRFVTGRGTEPRPLHNVYLQFVVEIGILGGLAFLALVCSLWTTFRRASNACNSTLRHYSEALLIGHFALCVQLLFLSSKSFLGLWILVGIAIAVARLRAEEKS